MQKSGFQALSSMSFNGSHKENLTDWVKLFLDESRMVHIDQNALSEALTVFLLFQYKL